MRLPDVVIIASIFTSVLQESARGLPDPDNGVAYLVR